VTLFRRKIWGDRGTWVFVLLATVAVVDAWIMRHNAPWRTYVLIAWVIVVLWLLGYTELRIGRKQIRRGRDAMFLGLAAFVGEERVDASGERTRVWTGTAAGALAFEPEGVRWVPKFPDEEPGEISMAWPDIYSWRIGGVLPFLGRASGYLMFTLYGGRELVFAIYGVRNWRRAVREAAIVGPTLRPVAEAAAAPATAVDPATEAVYSPAPEQPPAPEVEYEAVIGLECHVELATVSKMFCACPTTFGTAPNTQVCPVCTGQPGTLPVPNKKAIEYTLRIGMALGGNIPPSSLFHRKNYFYPDMPKNYQISQYDVPMVVGGVLEYDVDGETRRCRIHRVHLEEDTGKIRHGGEGGRIGDAEHSLIDYNRAGIPLVEIVSEADLRSPEEAPAYLAELRTLLLTLGVSDVRLEEGSLRCDANISIRPKGTEEYGTKVEVKNMNSLRSVQRALSYEIERQTEELEAGRTLVQETRHFDESTGRTIGGRTKEYSADYRYFPDPDLVPIAPQPSWLDEIRSHVPELPTHRRRRFVADYELREEDARTLVADPRLADAFEDAVRAYGGSGKAIARWYNEDLAQLANERGVAPQDVGVSPSHVAQLQRLVDEQKVTISIAKGEVLKRVADTGEDPRAIVESAGLTQIADEGELGGHVDAVIAANPDAVEKIRGGKTGTIGFLVGEVMKRTGGKANAGVVKQLIDERLNAQV
jgi:aspartyl-tRNA(Asn)/glutamyl-tRNA(Gln) amidotransferase subunit B